VAAEKRRFEPWPVALAAALTFMIATSIAFLCTAIRHPDAILVADSYAAEPAVAEDLLARSRGADLGWELAVVTLPRAGGVAVDAAMLDAAGRNVAVERMVVRRERPAEGGLDAEVALVREGDRFRGDIALPRGGRWQLVVRAEHDGAVVERRLAIWGPG